MNNPSVITYVYGMIYVQLIAACIFVVVGMLKAKKKRYYYLGPGFGAIFCVITAWRNYRFFVCQGNMVSDDVLYASFFASAVLLAYVTYEWLDNREV